MNFQIEESNHYFFINFALDFDSVITISLPNVQYFAYCGKWNTCRIIIVLITGLKYIYSLRYYGA